MLKEKKDAREREGRRIALARDSIVNPSDWEGVIVIKGARLTGGSKRALQNILDRADTIGKLHEEVKQLGEEGLRIAISRDSLIDSDSDWKDAIEIEREGNPTNRCKQKFLEIFSKAERIAHSGIPRLTPPSEENTYKKREEKKGKESLNIGFALSLYREGLLSDLAKYLNLDGSVKNETAKKAFMGILDQADKIKSDLIRDTGILLRDAFGIAISLAMEPSYISDWRNKAQWFGKDGFSVTNKGKREIPVAIQITGALRKAGVPKRIAGGIATSLFM